jgi:protein-disulfide isomerase
MKTLAPFLWFALVACGGGAGVVHAPVAAPGETTPKEPRDAPMVPKAAQGEEDAGVPISTSDPAWGSRTALVTIVEFSDFQCPYCSRVNMTMAQLREEYGAEDLRIVWKNMPLPFHPEAKPAAEAAMGVMDLAGSRGFWAFHDLAFKNQSQLSRARYEEWARVAGADGKRLSSGLDAHQWASRVEEDMELGKRLGVSGTPHFFINGLSIVGAQPPERFKQMIDDEMNKAKEKIAQGTPRSRVYVVMSQENRKNQVDIDDD